MTVAVDQVSEQDFTAPEQLCDIVMKGGVTSGIVYPPAILRIAQKYRFKSIGGTSAGAIAAAVAAAAEFRRAAENSGAGFLLLKTGALDWLRSGRNLRSLFVPTVWTAPLFWAVLWVVGLAVAKRKLSIAGAAMYGITFLLAAALVAGYCQAFFINSGSLVLVICKYLAVAAFAGLLWTAICILFIMTRSNYGICTGGRKGTLAGLLRVEPLTFWLSRQIDQIAHGRVTRPLTFGDLWSGKLRPDLGEPIVRPSDPVINLEMVTTCLTLGRPFSLPFDTEIFYFRPDELSTYFPEYVVQWMQRHARQADPKNDAQVQRHKFLRDRGYYPLPKACDLPVVVATRLSLSFPFLLSAIRLYAIDRTLPSYNKLQPTIEPVWFSDGGLSSNFPISLFDSPIPRWPTLGITLEEFPPETNESNPNAQVWMPQTNAEGIGSTWMRFSQGRVPANTPGFYGAILNAMQNWQDTMQSEAPGFRDRIAHVRLTKEQGGLNLAMPDDVIAALMARGELAGEKLSDRFTIPVPATGMTWRNHRWIRLRTITSALERFALQFDIAWNRSSPPCDSYETLVRGGVSSAPSYKLSGEDQVEAALGMASELGTIARTSDLGSSSLAVGDPKPESELRARPRF